MSANNDANFFSESELVLNPDGSIYHLGLHPEQLADMVILVGDPNRVSQISTHLDSITDRVQNREFITHTGRLGARRISIISTGIGTDNIDIAVNELDALCNIDLETRSPRSQRKSLELIRIGTSGSLQPAIPPGSFILSAYGLGFDGLIYYYDWDQHPADALLNERINAHLAWNPNLATPYLIGANAALLDRLGDGMIQGITATATGFYGPQGRKLGLDLADPLINNRLASFRYGELQIVNYEMETSALYALGSMLGHRCCTCCLALANRHDKGYKADYKSDMNQLIQTVLQRI